MQVKANIATNKEETEINWQNNKIKMIYAKLIEILKAYMPKTRARLSYFIAYKRLCNLNNPKSFSEKLLWLSLNTYRNNPEILKLSDKFLVREYVENKGLKHILNEVYFYWNNAQDINFEVLPESFVLKLSQGCQTNIISPSDKQLNIAETKKIVSQWSSGQYFYDKMMADIGGISVNDLKKYYICERFLYQSENNDLTDFKIYCFNGEPKAILVIEDRYGTKRGAFMSPEWKFISDLSGSYSKMSNDIEKPKSLDEMIKVAKKLSQDFPFVRVDLYDISGKVVFGELTFFPNGCVNMQETKVNGIDMGDLLDITVEGKL